MSRNICFVCNLKLSGQRYQLATYQLKYSQVTIIEKLANFLGDSMVLICRPDDFVCESCVSLMEATDGSEHKAEHSKKLVLQLLKNKCSLLENGEIRQHTHLPESTKMILNEVEDEPVSQTTRSNSFFARKRKSEEDVERLKAEVTEDPKSQIILKCNTCQYQINYVDFEKRHIKTKTLPSSHSEAFSTSNSKIPETPTKVDEDESETFLKSCDANITFKAVDAQSDDGEGGGYADIEEEDDYQLVEITEGGEGSDSESHPHVTLINSDQNMHVVWDESDANSS